VVHWRRQCPPGWSRRAAINATGALATAVATGIFLITKFTAGGWVVVVTVLLFHRVRAYYDDVAKATALRPGALDAVPEQQVLVVVPVNGVSQVNVNGAMTKSPLFRSRTASPTSSTTPMYSWPRRCTTRSSAT